MISKVFGSEKKQDSHFKDYGNISSSGNDEMDIADDLYRYQYTVKSELPLNIAGNDSAQTQDFSKDLDLSILYKALYPTSVLQDRTNDKIWTFDSILSDLEKAFKSRPQKSQ